MRAYRLVEWQQAPAFREVAVPAPGPGQVLLKVGGAGVCHSDLHLVEWPPGALPYAPPFTLGHENAGWVERPGAGVEGLAVGDPVLVYGAWGCGRCRPCRSGLENYCDELGRSRPTGGGLGVDGGMAPYLLVPSARFLLPLRSLDPARAAPLADAGLTAYHAVKRAVPVLEPGATAVVIGAGGLGQMAVQYLRALTPARVLAVDAAPAKLALARELGADLAVASGAAAAPELLEATRGRGAEAILDFVGTDETMSLGARLARKRGQLTIVGLGGGTLPFRFSTIPRECSVSTTYWGSIAELAEVVALAESGRATARVETFPLDQAPEVYERLRRGELDSRAVIVPGE